jgi:hypothetical protein
VNITYPKAAHTSGDKANGLAKYVSERKVANRLRYSSGESFHKIIFLGVDASSFISVTCVEQLNRCRGDPSPPLRLFLASCFELVPTPSAAGDTVDIIVVGEEDDEDDNSNAARQLAKVTSTHDASSSADLAAVSVVEVFMVMKLFIC